MKNNIDVSDFNEKKKPFTVKRLIGILESVNPDAIVMFEDYNTQNKKSKKHGNELIKDVIVQKNEYPNNNGEIAHHVILINEFLNLNEVKED